VHGLGAEELVLEVHGDPVVPVFGCDRIERVAVVAGGIVDQDRDVAVGPRGLGDGFPEGCDVAEIGLEEERGGMARGLGGGHGLQARFPVEIDEGDLALLLGEGQDGGGADAGAATGDQDGAAFEARIGRELRHGACLIRLRMGRLPSFGRATSGGRRHRRRGPRWRW
jgi:hypothetical protein